MVLDLERVLLVVSRGLLVEAWLLLDCFWLFLDLEGGLLVEVELPAAHPQGGYVEAGADEAVEGVGFEEPVHLREVLVRGSVLLSQWQVLY